MKKLTSFLRKAKSLMDKEFAIYTAVFFGLMMILYIYALFEIGTDAPKFTYAEF